MRLPESWSNATRTELAVRAGMVVIVLVLMVMLVVWGADLARRIGKLGAPAGPSPEQQVLALQGELSKLKAEHAKTVAAADSAASASAKLTAAVAAQEQQARQVKALEQENKQLKEQLAAWTAKPPVAPKVASASATAINHGLMLRRFDARLTESRVLQYRLLLSQPASAPKLIGRLQLVLTVKRGTKVELLKYPSAAAANASQFAVKLGQMQRCEGTLAVPEGVTVKSIQARVLEKGQVRIARSVAVRDAAQVRS